jgi:C4-dicarboxylate-specific signal transduction histidine kinase
VALPLSRQIIILNAAILVPVFAVLVWSAQQTYREQLDQLASETRAVAATVVVYLDRGLDIPAVQGVIESVPLPAGSVITITDDRSIVLARSRDRERYVGRPTDASPSPPAQVPEVVLRKGVDGIARVYANEIFEPGSMVVSAGIPTRVAYERTLPIYRRNFGLTISVTMLTLLLEFVFVRRYVRAFDSAVARSARVAAGDLTPLPPTNLPSLEFERLERSFIDMVSKLRDAREALSAQVAEERRIREELQLLQRQVIRQERLAAIGVLVSGVAHELNNPLQAILGFAELLQSRADLPAHMRADLELMQKESARASAIIRNLSRFGRQQTPDPTPVRLRDVVASVTELRQRKLEESHIEFDVDDRSRLPTLAVFTELQQVVLNFLINAEQALTGTPGRKRIVIRTFDVEDRVRLEVQDSGPGVARDHEAKLFQPFFTTKPIGEGTGLGLSVSYGIVRHSGGTIGYARSDGPGALFYFELPARSDM